MIREACAEIGIDKIDFDIFQEHVSIVIEVAPQYGVHKAIKTIKSITSRILCEEFVELKTKLPTLWSNSYFVSTEANVSEEVIQAYIKSQATSQRNEAPTRKKRKTELQEETREV